MESGGTFNMTSGTITGGSAGQMGAGGIYVEQGATCTISDSTVKDCSDSGIITAGNFKMSGNTEVKNNTTGFFGGGISVIGGTAQIASGTKITGNKGEYGAGLAVSGGATLTANGLTITSGQPVFRDCTGGGLFIGDSTVSLKNCNISSNTVTNGGGVCVEGGSLTMEDSEISENTVSGNGGGIYMKGGSYENKNTTIKTNSASNGGGVYMLNGNFTMSSGSITKNSATTANSSGVYIGKTIPNDMAYFYQNGGSITENNNGGLLIDVFSVYYNQPAKSVIVSGSGSIDNNTGSNVYIANEDSILTIGGALSGSYKVQTQTSPAAGELLPIAVANDGYSITAADLSKITAQSGDESVILQDNKLSLMSNVFSDVSDEYEKDVNAFVSAGIIDGFEDGTFKGEQGLTRAEFVKIMSIILKLSVNSNTDKFTDTQGHWAQRYIAEFTKLGYLKGYEDGSFKPDQKMTRAEFVTIVNRIIQKNGMSIPPVFSDLSAGHWAYTDIMAAYLK